MRVLIFSLTSFDFHASVVYQKEKTDVRALDAKTKLDTAEEKLEPYKKEKKDVEALLSQAELSVKSLKKLWQIRRQSSKKGWLLLILKLFKSSSHRPSLLKSRMTLLI